MMTLKLTDLERECLRHRLDDVDSIAESLGWGKVRVLSAINRFDHGYSDDDVREVIAEAVEGSTWYGSILFDPKLTAEKLYACELAGHSLGAKVTEFTGRYIEFPAY